MLLYGNNIEGVRSDIEFPFRNHCSNFGPRHYSLEEPKEKMRYLPFYPEKENPRIEGNAIRRKKGKRNQIRKEDK